MASDEAIEVGNVMELRHEVGEERHESMISLELIASLVDHLLELRSVKDVKGGPRLL